MDKIKVVEDWYMPIDESSIMKKMSSIREAYKNPQYPIDDYQSELRLEAMKYVSGLNAVIDGGAHIGIWSVAFSKDFKMVHAFEINPDTLPCLKLNIESRQIQNVTIYPYGLGQETSLVKITPTLKKSMGTSVVPFENGNIEVRALDSFNLSGIDLIKLDVEGYETFALLGGIQTILNSKPIIVMEDKNLNYNYGADVISPSKVLEDLGMKVIKRFRKDVIYGF